MHIFFSVGEPSGDQHAAHLIHELRRRCPTAVFSGFGGPLMRQAGCQELFPLTDLAVMGIWSVIPLLRTFLRLVREAGVFFRKRRPDAVVLVDFPGFNWWIARRARQAGIRVFYYMPPQLWAWAPWRIRKVRRFVDHVLAALPFEAEWYAARGVDVEHVGHPFFDEVADHRLQADVQPPLSGQLRGDAAGRTQWLRNVAILPGSRKAEVVRNFPVMLEVMSRLHAAHPDVRFRVACYKEMHRDLCAACVAEGYDDLPIDLYVGCTPEIIESAAVCLMVSGSVSLEVLARRKPAVVLYRCPWAVYFIGGPLLRCRYISLPNLIANHRVMPEFPFLFGVARAIHRITAVLDGWLSDEAALQAACGAMTALCGSAVVTGATARAADAILRRSGPQSAAAGRSAA